MNDVIPDMVIIPIQSEQHFYSVQKFCFESGYAWPNNEKLKPFIKKAHKYIVIDHKTIYYCDVNPKELGDRYCGFAWIQAIPELNRFYYLNDHNHRGCEQPPETENKYTELKRYFDMFTEAGIALVMDHDGCISIFDMANKQYSVSCIEHAFEIVECCVEAQRSTDKMDAKIEELATPVDEGV